VISGQEAVMAASAEERSPDEQIKMTVSERGIRTLATALQDWLTDRLGRPGQLTVSGVRTPGSGGLSSTSVLFEANWISQGTRRGGAYVARMAPEDSAVPVFIRRGTWTSISPTPPCGTRS
jgi:hypothetical protein